MTEAVIVDGLRTPIGKLRGSLSGVRPDDLAAGVIGALLDRQPAAREDVEEVIFGDTNQAGEDNRNVARMASLLAGLPYEVAAEQLGKSKEATRRLVGRALLKLNKLLGPSE